MLHLIFVCTPHSLKQWKNIKGEEGESWMNTETKVNSFSIYVEYFILKKVLTVQIIPFNIKVFDLER